MIPNNMALIPENAYQRAAIHAIDIVETKRAQGKRLGRFPYAREMFRCLNGRSNITATDINVVASNYDPKERLGATKERYIEVLDILIASQGMQCYLPLSISTVETFFPEIEYLNRQKRERRRDKSTYYNEKKEKQQRQQKRRRYQCQVAQAQIGLAFTTPSQLKAWYMQWSKHHIYDDDLIEIVQAWSKRFLSMPNKALNSGQPLWAIVEDTHQELSSRTLFEQWIDNLSLSNKIGMRV